MNLEYIPKPEVYSWSWSILLNLEHTPEPGGYSWNWSLLLNLKYTPESGGYSWTWSILLNLEYTPEPGVNSWTCRIPLNLEYATKNVVYCLTLNELLNYKYTLEPFFAISSLRLHILRLVIEGCKLGLKYLYFAAVGILKDCSRIYIYIYMILNRNSKYPSFSLYYDNFVSCNLRILFCSFFLLYNSIQVSHSAFLFCIKNGEYEVLYTQQTFHYNFLFN